MYLLIGKENCSRCEMIKNILTNKNIEFEYKMLESFSEEEKKNYIKLGREFKQTSFPLIIKDNTALDIKEVI